MPQNNKLAKLPPKREKLEEIGILTSQKIGRESIYVNTKLIEILKKH